jgi:hypothetical protein
VEKTFWCAAEDSGQNKNAADVSRPRLKGVDVVEGVVNAIGVVVLYIEGVQRSSAEAL